MSELRELAAERGWSNFDPRLRNLSTTPPLEFPRITDDVPQTQGRTSGDDAGKAEVARPSDITAVLTERGERYGKFCDHAEVSQQLKSALMDRAIARNLTMEADQYEALEMICHKLARIVNGDPDYADSWTDIAGYATLVADRLGGVAR